MGIVYLLAACTNSVVDHFLFNVMFMINNLIEPCLGKVLLNHLIGNSCPKFRNGLLGIYFSKLTSGSDCLELYFCRVTFKTNLT